MRALTDPRLVALLLGATAATVAARPMLSPVGSHAIDDDLLHSLKESYVDLGSPGARDEVNHLAEGFHTHLRATHHPDLFLVHDPDGPGRKSYDAKIEEELKRFYPVAPQASRPISKTDWEKHFKLPPKLYLPGHLKLGQLPSIVKSKHVEPFEAVASTSAVEAGAKSSSGKRGLETVEPSSVQRQRSRQQTFNPTANDMQLFHDSLL